MALGIFDMDDTLVDGDSANLWLHYLVERGRAPSAMLPREEALLQAYREGRVDMREYVRFALEPIRGLTREVVAAWMAEFVEGIVLPRIFPEALRQLEWHRARGDRLLIVSATGEHLVSAIADRLGVKDSIGIVVETRNGCYTGDTHGELSYREGKVSRIRAWLNAEGESLDGSYGYSDSFNDVSMLAAVDHGHAVNPDATLRAIAMERGWQVLHWLPPSRQRDGIEK
ncbi:HAD family hydrolase [Paraburkholderia sacchari]|uniref:HAD family hydrolase n=2 Tax=Paraburkholderia sacchari TaxID=159450 RepID=UPI00054229FB|nr:HAD family hydrolase [Paraburkholderia sacchari]NLP63194.1 HAD family hydrolase [Paraburkholderia sacchari]